MKRAMVWMMLAAMAALLIGGCAAPMSSLSKAQEAYEAKKAEEDTAKAERDRVAAEARKASEAAAEKEIERQLAAAEFAKAQQAEAKRIEEEAKAKADALKTRAAELEAIAAKEAAALKKSALELDPIAGEPDDEASPPPPAQLPPAPPTFLDIEVSSWTAAGVKRLTPYPAGWSLKVDAERLYVYDDEAALMPAMTFRRPSGWRGPVCYRLSASPSGVVVIDRCPAGDGSGSGE